MKNRTNAERFREALKKAVETCQKEGMALKLCEPESTFTDEEDNAYFDSIWHGGTMLTIEDNEMRMTISATGNVEATVYDATGEIIAEVKDRRNLGYFEGEVKPTLHGDKELYAAENGEHPKGITVEFRQNNWYELFVDKKSSEELCQESVALDEFDLCLILEHIEDVIESGREVCRDY